MSHCPLCPGHSTVSCRANASTVSSRSRIRIASRFVSQLIPAASDDKTDLAVRPQRFEIEDDTPLENGECPVVARDQLVVISADIRVDVLKAHAVDDEISGDRKYITVAAENADVADHVPRAGARIFRPSQAAEQLLHARA